MTEAADISDEALRKSLIARATAFCEANHYSFSRIGDEAVKDSKFLSRVASGGNFTIKTYQRVLDWLDKAERKAA